MLAIRRVIKIVGSQAKLARHLGVSDSFVSQIRKNKRPVPPKHCRTIKHLTNGRVMEWELRPDIFDPPNIAMVG